MKELLKRLWIPIVTAVAIVVIIILLRIIPGVFIALFDSDFLMYIWYEIFLATIVGATAVTVKTATRLEPKLKWIYYIFSFIIISNTYYLMGINGLYVNLF